MSQRGGILVTRTDRLGDVMLAVPTLFYLRDAMPDVPIDFLCRDDVFDVLSPSFSSRGIGGLSGTRRVAWEKYDAALLLHPEYRLCLDAWRARVPIRVGPLSRPWSFFLLNRGKRQRRSDGVRNEGEYNLALGQALAREMGAGHSVSRRPVELQGELESLRRAADAILSLGLPAERPFIVLHPGMGGSATNVSIGDYRDIICRVRELGAAVVLSKGPAEADQDLVRSLQQEFSDLPVLERLTLPVLREVFRRARVVVAPATGPLHLAHCTGTAVVGIYSNVRSQRKERWAPWGGTGVVRALDMEEGNLPERVVGALKEIWRP